VGIILKRRKSLLSCLFILLFFFGVGFFCNSSFGWLIWKKRLAGGVLQFGCRTKLYVQFLKELRLFGLYVPGLGNPLD
jgi:hypothetical protein